MQMISNHLVLPTNHNGCYATLVKDSTIHNVYLLSLSSVYLCGRLAVNLKKKSLVCHGKDCQYVAQVNKGVILEVFNR